MRITRGKQYLLVAIWFGFFGALFSASFFPPPLLAEEMLRIGTEDPFLPTQPRPVIQSAGFAFAGTVKAVEHVSPGGRNRIGTTRIAFHVDTAIRGVRTGQTLVVTEWAALWASGERYRPGERVCLFLYPPSKLGSPARCGARRDDFASEGRGGSWYPQDSGGPFRDRSERGLIKTAKSGSKTSLACCGRGVSHETSQHHS